MSRKLLIALFAGTLINLVLIALASATGTADGLPPSLEDACSGQTGAAYGLCNAYCEAMDCDSDPLASDTACARVFDKYQQITGKDLFCTSCPMYGTSGSPSFTYLVSTGPIDGCYYNASGLGDASYGNILANDNNGIWAGMWWGQNGYIWQDDTGPTQHPLTPEQFTVCSQLLEAAIVNDLETLDSCGTQYP